MNLNLRPDIEERLLSLASANGVSLEAFLQQVVEEKDGSATKPRLSSDEWSRQFEEWADSFPDAPPIPDEALSRENLNPDRW
jgi:hypothetical protein